MNLLHFPKTGTIFFLTVRKRVCYHEIGKQKLLALDIYIHAILNHSFSYTQMRVLLCVQRSLYAIG